MDYNGYNQNNQNNENKGNNENGYQGGYFNYDPKGPETPPTYNEENHAPAPGQGMPITALVLGIASICCCCNFFAGIPAIILALVDRNRRHRFDGMALAGLICGIIGILFGALGIIMAEMLNAMQGAGFGGDGTFAWYTTLTNLFSL